MLPYEPPTNQQLLQSPTLLTFDSLTHNITITTTITITNMPWKRWNSSRCKENSWNKFMSQIVRIILFVYYEGNLL